MPSPLQILLDPLSIGVLVLYGAMIAWEAVAPARQLSSVPGWIPRALGSFMVFFYLSSYLPLLWDSYLVEYRVLDLQHLGLLPGLIIALFAYNTMFYAWHRSMHASDGLWLAFHQLHHSAERLDTFGAFFLSPMDTIGFTFISSLAFALLGFSPQVSTAFLFVSTFLAIFQHANVRTPQWIGYFVQRPESHSVHHEKGVHRYNFADLPVLDIVFRTFRNPEEHVKEAGFYPGASARVADMLLLKDVSRPVERELVDELAQS